jgi:hypothetical protein
MTAMASNNWREWPVPPASYFGKIQAVLEKYDILFWDDEVICGFGRLGADFGARALDMKPRMMVLAKGLSEGIGYLSARQNIRARGPRGRVPAAATVYLRDTSAGWGSAGHGFDCSAGTGR